jgi:2-iminobutanoate/2-iminopropanoate deaminase
VRAGNLIFVSGQLPRDPRTRQVVGTDVATQTRQVFANIEVILSAAGVTLRDIVSVTVYLADMSHWAAFDAVYRELMQPPYPARAAVGAQLNGALVEVSIIAQAS